MPKHFINRNAIKDGTIYISGEDAHHFIHVLRIRIGESVILCDGAGTDYQCEVKKIEKPAALVLSVVNEYKCLAEPETKITLYQSLPKGDKMEWIIQKCVEVGVYAVVPLITERTQIRISDWKPQKTVRYQRIAEAAAAQSMRGIIPQVCPPVTINDLLAMKEQHCLMLAAYENEHTLTIKEALLGRKPNSVGLLIGPEGGFSDDEITLMRQNQFITVSLGRRILRAETAGLTALVQILFMLEDF